MNALTESRAAPATCPVTGRRGRAVSQTTLRSLLRPEAQDRIGAGPWYFCDSSECDVVYFDLQGNVFRKGDLTVRVGIKETTAPRPICYCFNHSIEEIEQQVQQTGDSTVLEDIKAQLKQGCWCQTTNPQGSCCLASVQKVIEQAKAKYAAAVGTDHDCCADKPFRARADAKAAVPGLLTSAGAVAAAIVSSACCWLPLLLIALGASAAGVAAVFEKLRPIVLTLAAILLAGSFYLVYRTPRCQPGQACAAPQTRLRRMNKAMLWIATVLVLAFALFPSYVGVLLGGGSSGGGTSSGGGSIASGETSTVTFEISGMTCEGCAAALQSRLAKLPGVVRAEVCFATKTAKVVLDTNRTRLSDETLLKAIEQAGFRGTEIRPGYSPAGGHAPTPRASGSGYRQITP